MAIKTNFQPYIFGSCLAVAMFTLLFLFPNAASAWTYGDKGLVPECSISRYEEGGLVGVKNFCNFCHVLQLIKNLLDYTYLVILPVVLTIALVWGGAYMFFSAFSGDTEKSSRGKKIISRALIGAALMLGAWLIIDTVIKLIGGRIGSQTASAPFLPWNQIECMEPQVSATPPPPGVPPPPPVSVGAEQTLANALYTAALCGGKSDCGSDGPCTTLRNVSQGFPPPVCSSGCTSTTPCPQNPNVHLSLTMLRALDSLHKDGYKFMITSLTTGSHTQTSKHYQGKAVDIVAREQTTYSQLEAALYARGATLVQCEKNRSRVNCGSNSIDHVHAEFP